MFRIVKYVLDMREKGIQCSVFGEEVVRRESKSMTARIPVNDTCVGVLIAMNLPCNPLVGLSSPETKIRAGWLRRVLENQFQTSNSRRF